MANVGLNRVFGVLKDVYKSPVQNRVRGYAIDIVVGFKSDHFSIRERFDDAGAGHVYIGQCGWRIQILQITANYPGGVYSVFGSPIGQHSGSNVVKPKLTCIIKHGVIARAFNYLGTEMHDCFSLRIRFFPLSIF
jgi:hypothetical protein